MSWNNFLGILFIFFYMVDGLFAQISGRVTDIDTNPIEGVSVFLSNGSVDVTDAEGSFHFTDKSSHSISFDHIGYQIYTINLKDYSGDLTQIIVTMSRKFHALSTIEVLGNWAEENQAVTTTTLGKKDIQDRNNGQDVPYILQWTPSTQVYSDAGAGIGYSYIRIRGSDQERINFTINGVPLNDAESQQVFWVDLPDFATSAQVIQIQRGLGLSTNGTGAFGASVNISTAQVSDEASSTISAGIGSFGTYKGSVQFASGALAQNFHLDGRLSLIRSDGYIDRASSDLQSFYLSGNYVGEKQTVTFNAFSGQEVTYQAWNGVPINFVDDDKLRTFNSAGMERLDRPHDNQVDDYGQTHVQLIHRAQLSTSISSNLTLHYTKGKGFFELYQGREQLADYGLGPVQIVDSLITHSDLIERRWLDNDFYGVIANFKYGSSQKAYEIKWGGGWNRYIGQHFGEVIWAQISDGLRPDHRYYDNQGKKMDINLFSQFNYSISNSLQAFVDLQYRRVDYKFVGLDENGTLINQKVDHNFVNPKAGISYQLDNGLKAYGYVGYGHKEPNRNDYTESSPLSRPMAEKMLNIELGVSKPIGIINLNANVYVMNYTDQLIPTGQLNDVGATTRINADKSYRLGLEWGVQSVLTNRFEIGIGGTISKNKISNYNFYLDSYDSEFNYIGQEVRALSDVDIAFSPNLLFDGHISWEAMSGLRLLLDGKYVGRQYLDNTQNQVASLDPHGFINGTMEYVIKSKSGPTIKLKVLIQNILNQKYENFGWTYPYLFDGETTGDYTQQVSDRNYRDIGLYPQAGINYMMGVTVEF